MNKKNQIEAFSLFPVTTLRCRLDPDFLSPLPRLMGVFFTKVLIVALSRLEDGGG
jgi:hypothetical protein